MDQRLTEVLHDREGNYILPFLWVMGEPWEKTRAQIHHIHECGVRAFCVESRVFEDFCGDTWWPFIQRVFDEAASLGMKVWILDDVHFPTGFAVGMIPKKYPERRKWHLCERHVDVLGPRKATLMARPLTPEDRLLGVYAYRRTAQDESLSGEPIALKTDETGRYVHFDVPEDCWRVFFLWNSRSKQAGCDDRIHMIDESSVDVLIEAVYEAHYQRLAPYFGNTFVGFFSDEPCFGNKFYVGGGPDPGFYNISVGMPGLGLPWRDDLRARMTDALGEDALPQLPYLWFGGDGAVERVRTCYMDQVTKLYRECFCRRLGDWCHAHGIEYIGHIIEDMNAHTRLGNSSGHYFRSLEGQDMSGIDIVLHQVLPGFANFDNAAVCAAGKVDSEFFHFALGKLAESLAHIRPHMHGRAMCEVFGAYGWTEDMPMMKWLIDFLLVRGVNHFVPHAFSPVFPNPDCPPHFDAEGKNPQFDDFQLLMRYTNKMAHLLTELKRLPRVAVLYNAEAEWSGQPCMLDQKVARVLTERQIDFDIVPADDLSEPKLSEGRWLVGDAAYDLLIVPASGFLPDAALRGLERLTAGGVSVLHADQRAPGAVGETIPLADLGARLTTRGYDELDVQPASPMLRVFHGVRGNTRLYMLFNESTQETLSGSIRVAGRSGLAVRLLEDDVEPILAHDGRVEFSLVPYQSVLFLLDDEARLAPAPEAAEGAAADLRWDIALARPEALDQFETIAKEQPIATIEAAEPDFAGRIRYRARFRAVKGAHAVLTLSGVGDTALVMVNGAQAGRRICPPYRYVLDALLRDGENELDIIASTTLARAVEDRFAPYVAMNRPGVECARLTINE